jgi:low temperature requirement protein LtrA
MTKAGRPPGGVGDGAGGAGTAVSGQPPLRVTTLELFFDLVFAFTLTQLSALLASGLSVPRIFQVLLIFGLLWWMYGGYTWLTNARPPVHTAERLLLLVAMAGFLTVGLAIPDGFGRAGLELGLGYLVVVIVHSSLYFRVNRNIIKITPFNIASALLVICAGLLARSSGGAGPAGYALWIAAVAIQLGSPLLVHPRGLFELRAAHLVERYGALLMVALGESVAAIGIGAARLAEEVGAASARLVTAALLGLALAAALWWIVFGGDDQDRGERVMSSASSERRTSLAMTAYFRGNIPLLLGVIAVAAGVQQAIEHSARLTAGPLRAAVVLAAGVTLFLAGNIAFRLQLRAGPIRLRVVAAVLALATAGLGASVALDAQLVLLTAILAAMLVLERRQHGQVAAG